MKTLNEGCRRRRNLSRNERLVDVRSGRAFEARADLGYNTAPRESTRRQRPGETFN
jgi:hypothetical protein